MSNRLGLGMSALITGFTMSIIHGQDLEISPLPRRTSELVSGELANILESGAESDTVVIMIEADDYAAFDPSRLKHFGGRVLSQVGSNFEVELPLADVMRALTGIPGVEYARLPFATSELDFVSQGVPLSAAERLHDLDIRGQGIDVAVIDLGFNGLTESIEFGDLPEPEAQVNFASGPFEGYTYHGTAVAEVLHEMAPLARLHLIRIQNENHLSRAVDYCRRSNIRVINHSVGWFNTNFYDGGGIVCDIARRAIDSGILWVNAAGNSAQRHYEGTFKDTDGDHWCDFTKGDEGIDFVAVRGTPIRIAMTWNSWITRDSDLDLYLLNERNETLASSRGRQGKGQPSELLDFVIEETGLHRLAIHHAGGRSDVLIELYSFTVDIESAHRVPRSSLVSPGDAQEVLTVGAVHWTSYNTGPQESFSSRGPNNAGISKPDMVGPDSVNSSIYGIFAGTSAAAPHVAGAAALLLSWEPSHSVESLTELLKGLSIPLGDKNIYGSGNLWLWDDLSPWPDPVELDAPSRALTHQSLSLRSRLASDPSLVDYAFKCLSDPRLSSQFQPFIEAEIRGLRANTLYEYSVQTRDRSPALNVSEVGPSRFLRTFMEPPKALSLEALGTSRISVEVQGDFTNLGVGKSAIRLECDGLGTPSSEWTQTKKFLFQQARPNTRYEFFAQSRNSDGVEGTKVGPYVIVTDAAVPPRPKLVRGSDGRSVLRLEDGLNPPDTELTLFETRSRKFLRPSGALSSDPVFYPSSSWSRVLTDRLTEGQNDLRAQGRNQSGRLTALSPGILVEIERETESPSERGPSAGNSSGATPEQSRTSRGERVSISDLRIVTAELRSRGVVLYAVGESAGRDWVWYRDGNLMSSRTSVLRDEDLAPNHRYTYSAELAGEGTPQRVQVDLVTNSEVPSRWSVAHIDSTSLQVQVYSEGWDEIRFACDGGRGPRALSDWSRFGEAIFEGLSPLSRVEVLAQTRNVDGEPTPFETLTSLSLPPMNPHVVPRWIDDGTSSFLDLTHGVQDGLEMAIYDVERGVYVKPDGVQTPWPSFLDRSRYSRLNWASRAPMKVLIHVRQPGGSAATSVPVSIQEPLPTQGVLSTRSQSKEALWSVKWSQAPRIDRNNRVLLKVDAHGAWPHENVFVERRRGENAVRIPVPSSLVEWTDDTVESNASYAYTLKWTSEEGDVSALSFPCTVVTNVCLSSIEAIEIHSNRATIRVDGAIGSLGRERSKLTVSIVGKNATQSIVTTLPQIEITDLESDHTYQIIVSPTNLEGVEGDSIEMTLETAVAPKIESRVEFLGSSELGLEWKGKAPGLFALYDSTRSVFVASDGSTMPRPSWSPISAYSYVGISNLQPSTLYRFQLKRRSVEGEAVSVGSPLSVRTKN